MVFFSTLILRRTDKHTSKTLRITGLPEKLHYSLFCLRCQAVRVHVIASHCGFQQLISFRQTSWYPGRSHFALSQFFVDSVCISSDRPLQRHGLISNCDSSVFQNQFLHSCYVNIRHRCVRPTACPVDHFRMLCTTFQYNALSLCHYSTPQSGEQVSPIKSYSHYEILREAKFPVLLSLYINLSCEQTLPLTPSVACYP